MQLKFTMDQLGSGVSGNAGDVTEVQAGTGISVASGTGPIPVVTNTMATEIDAKGDLVVGTGADTFARLAVGTDGHTLVADSGEATGLKWAVDPVADVITTAGDLIYGTAADTVARLGIGTAGQVLQVNSGATAPEWGAAAASSFVGVSAYLSSNQTISNNTFAAISWNAEYYDTDNFHSLSTNTSRLTVPSGKGGKYLITGSISWAANATETRTVTIYKNGSIVNYLDQMMAVTTSQRRTVQAYNIVIDLVATDYIEIFVWQTSGGNLDVTSDFDLITSVQMSYLGA
jgi:hypothetical protein